MMWLVSFGGLARRDILISSHENCGILDSVEQWRRADGIGSARPASERASDLDHRATRGTSVGPPHFAVFPVNSPLDLIARPSGAEIFIGGLQLFGDGLSVPLGPAPQMGLA
jgi:hypothetical protein